jgi:radical SAM superfamily enzyme YgiQ (UPF0313 family)
MKLLLSGAYSAIEPLGLMHLAGLARDMGWDRRIVLVKAHDFGPLFEAIDAIKKRWPMAVAVGGPHPTYFPETAAAHADFVVVSEGFQALARILDGVAEPGVLPFRESMRFPHPDRDTLYRDYPEFAASPIKSVLGMTGCPYACTYCYNSSTVGTDRLFPVNVRPIEDVVAEGHEIAACWPTKIISFPDDVHALDTEGYMPEFIERWPTEVGLPYHAQMRWEMATARRLDQVKAAGCTGLTLAVEAANYTIRKEVLDRGTPDGVMEAGMREIRARGLRVRTEQMVGLPYGATSVPTPMNLEADLELVALNVELKPDMAWAATFAPYAGTKLGAYAQRHGFYDAPENHDVPDTFFERTVLRFAREWVGPSLQKDDPRWLEGAELERYRDQNAALRRYFNVLCGLAEGHKAARRFMDTDLSAEAFSRSIRHHLYDEVLYAVG